MTWKPMSRNEAEQVIKDPSRKYSLEVLTLGEGARLREAQLVLKGWAPDDIYEALTDFLGRRPDEPLHPE
jgi:hypothetical protein